MIDRVAAASWANEYMLGLHTQESHFPRLPCYNAIIDKRVACGSATTTFDEMVRSDVESDADSARSGEHEDVKSRCYYAGFVKIICVIP